MNTQITVCRERKPAPSRATAFGVEWNEGCREFHPKERAHTQRQGRPSNVRCKLSWAEVVDNYVFDGPDGKVTLADLFDGQHQLNVYHVAVSPRWREGYDAWSPLADRLDALARVPHRGVSRVAVSRTPLPEIEAIKKHLGWRFPWVSSFHGTFNFDYYTSFTRDYGADRQTISRIPVVNAFRMEATGAIVHAYSAYVDDGDLPLFANYPERNGTTWDHPGGVEGFAQWQQVGI